MRTRSKIWRFAMIPSCFLFASILLVTLLRWVPVNYTPFMLKRAIQFRSDESYHREQRWVPLEEIPPEIINAVIFCEDQKFWSHHGFDWEEIRGMWRNHRQEGTTFRGCSTISQQAAKNVLTFGTPTLFRKIAESYWTCLIELIWGKERILEVYLNVAEMGKGLYGMKAAVDYYYELDLSGISAGQAVALAVCMPNPLKSNPIIPTTYERMRRSRIMMLMEKNSQKD